MDTSVQSFQKIPSPPGLPFVGHVLPMIRHQRMQWLSKIQNQWGDIFRIRLNFEDMVVLCHPDSATYLLKDHYKNYGKKSWIIDRMKAFLGEGLLTNEGESWLKQRKLTQPIFYKKRMDALSHQFAQIIQQFAQSWEKQAQQKSLINLNDEMMRLTLSITLQTLLGSQISPQSSNKINVWINAIIRETNRRMLYPFWPIEHFPIPQSWFYQRNIKAVDTIIYQIIEEKRKQKNFQDTLLDRLILARDDESQSQMTDQQLRDELVTFVFAGHETTSNTLAWAWLLLEQYPNVRSQLQQEIDDCIQAEIPSLETLEQLTYTRHFLMEVLRLYPPVPMILRSTLAEDQVQGYHIPAGTKMLISSYHIQRHPHFWENPLDFFPSRFETNYPPARFTYLPFGAGPRLCIGNHFAMLEATLALAMLVKRFRVHIPRPETVQENFFITYRPQFQKNVRLAFR